MFLLYFITNNAPRGADEVESTYECYKFAIENENELMKSEKAADIVRKIKKKYPLIKTQHILHVHGLTDDTLLQLVVNPRELINTLYQHDSILQFVKPNINKIAEEISNYNNLNLRKIHLSILKNWLSFSTVDGAENIDETLYEDLKIPEINSDVKYEENVIRANFLLSSWEKNEVISFLISQINENKKYVLISF